MINSHFGDIRQIIVELLKDSKHDIYIAVAWFTDKQLFQILLQKLTEGIDIKMILVKDKINLENGFDYVDFIQKGGMIFWDNHHHKFCVIDRRTVITGSYNWTYAANNRIKRENIIIITHEDELIDNYSAEFKTLIKQAEKYILPGTEVIKYIDRPVERIIEKIVEKPVIEIVNIGKPIVKYIEKSIDRIVEKEVLKSVKELVNVYTLYEKRGKYICGKCHSDKINVNPKAPKNLKNNVGFYCESCNTYFDKNRNSI